MKKRIRILAVENNINALKQMKRVFDNEEKFEFDGFQSSGMESTSIEITRMDQVNKIENKISEFDYDILIMDLLLRDNTSTDKEQLGEDFSGADKLISVQMAQKFKNEFLKRGILFVFTSASNSCKTHEKFEILCRQNSGIIPEESVFIFKPGDEKFKWENCPIDSTGNSTYCGKKRESQKGCCIGTCFRRLLEKYYYDFQGENGYE